MVYFYLFTDGGGFPKEEGKFDGVDAYRIYIHTDKGVKLLHKAAHVTVDATGQFGEISAIANGLEHICLYMKDVKIEESVSVKIYTDSMLYLKALSEWIFGWIKRAKNGVWFSKGNEPVKYQEQIMCAFKSILWIKKQNATLKFFHINSHKAKKDMKQNKLKFEKTNNCTVSDAEFLFIYKGNEAVDKDVQEAYTQFIESKKAENKSVEEKQTTDDSDTLVWDEVQE